MIENLRDMMKSTSLTFGDFNEQKEEWTSVNLKENAVGAYVCGALDSTSICSCN